MEGTFYYQCVQQYIAHLRFHHFKAVFVEYQYEKWLARLQYAESTPRQKTPLHFSVLLHIYIQHPKNVGSSHLAFITHTHSGLMAFFPGQPG